MNPLGTCCLLAVFHLALQAWPRILNPFFGVDCWRHMLAAQYVRTHGRLPESSLPNYLFTGAFDYPPLLVWILALFPERARLFLQAALAPAVEALHGILVFGVVLRWTGDAASAAAAQLIFALTPITALENSQLNARGLGSLFLTLTLVGGQAAFAAGRPGLFAAAAAAGALLHVTHKMASQTLLLFSVMALPLVPWIPGVPAVGIVSWLLAVVVFRRGYLRVLAGQWAVLKYYRRVFAAGPGAGRSVESASFVGRLAALVRSNPFVAILGADPWVAAVVLAAAGGAGLAMPRAVWLGLALWGGAACVLILATSLVRPLRFLGDGPRYAYYLAFPTAVLGGPMILSVARGAGSALPAAAAAALALAVLAQVLFVQARGVVPDKERSWRGDLRRIGEQLRATAGARVAVFPLCAAEVLAYFSGCAVLSTDSARAHAENADFRDFNPRMLRPLGHFLDKFGVTHCVARSNVPVVSEIPADFVRVIEGDDFVLWERGSRPPT